MLYRRTWPRVRDALVELRALETRSAEDVAALSADLLRRTVRRAAAGSPFLRELYAAHDVDVRDLGDPAQLSRLPVMTKDLLREHVERIVVEDADPDDLVRGATGGSTGVPSPYVHDTTWWCAATAAAWRGDEWTGWHLGERHTSVWGTPLEESTASALYRTATERARNFLFLPGFDLSPAVLSRRLDQLYRFRPVLVTGYASLLRAVADGIRAQGREPLRPLALVSSAEPLPDDTRHVIEEAFGAPVFNRYGCRELGIVAQECARHAGLHVFSTHVHVEIDAGGRPARPGESGRVLCTLLDNPSFPMIRYEVGDLAAPAAGPCACGLPYPLLERVDGRMLDVLWTSSGGALTGVFFPHLMKEFPWVGSFQVVQDETGAVELRVVPFGGAPGDDAQAALVEQARAALGELPVTVRLVEQLERTPAGKVRVTQSRYRAPGVRGGGDA